MIFINNTKSAQAAKDYFDRALAPSDYYLKDATELAGVWHGRGAEALGLSGRVTREQFVALADNFDPNTGKQLTPHTKGERRVMTDFTFDVPKSVSLAYELGGDERIVDAFRQSVCDTMGEMEQAVMTRVRKNGADTDRASSNMIWAEFVHRTTRPVDGKPDPQLHCHAVAFNATFDPVEDKWKAAQFSNLVRDKGYYQAAFHSRLAGHLADLGYGIERDRNSFKLAGIERATVEKFSGRSAEIDEAAQRLGIVSAKARGELGRRTRQVKKDEGSIVELRKEWDSRLTPEERKSIKRAQSGQETTTLDATQAMDYALGHSFERNSVVTEKELLRQALIHSVGNASVGEIKGELLRDGVITRSVDGQRYATTKEVLREETDAVGYVRQGRGKCRKLADQQFLDEGLSEEQRKAALVILNSRDAVTGLKGSAGTGKTRMMGATIQAIEADGKQVFTFAPSAEASRGVLRQEGFASADTVEKLLTDAELQQQIKGQVVWIDEAGLLSGRDMKRVFDLAKRQDARVILSGDSAQHSSVARGDSLRLLERDAGMKFAELKTIRRQTQESYRNAVSAISEGGRAVKGKTQLENGLDQLERMGAIVELPDDSRYRHLAADYVATVSEKTREGKQKTAIVVAPTHKEGDKVTAAIRDALKQTGKLTGKEREVLSLKARNLTEAERGDVANYQPGEIVQFQQKAKGFRKGERLTVSAVGNGVQVTRGNGETATLSLADAKHFQVYQAEKIGVMAGDKLRLTMNGYIDSARRPGNKDRLNNGAVYEVAGFNRQGDIKLTNGFVVPKDYGGLTHGVAVTSHASQGKTADAVFVALSQQSLAAANRQQLYVSVSRGREKVRLYTDDKEAMRAAVKSDASRLTATELMQGQAPSHRPSNFNRLIGLQRMQQAYQSVRERVWQQQPQPHREEQRHGLA